MRVIPLLLTNGPNILTDCVYSYVFVCVVSALSNIPTAERARKEVKQLAQGKENALRKMAASSTRKKSRGDIKKIVKQQRRHK